MKHAFESPYYSIEQGLPAAHRVMAWFRFAAWWQFPRRLLTRAQFFVAEILLRKRKHVKRIREKKEIPVP